MSLTEWAVFAVVVVAMIVLVRFSRIPTPPDAPDLSGDCNAPEVSDGGSRARGIDGDCGD